MKKLSAIVFLALAVAGIAYAGDLIQASFVQTGTGANGMTSAAPALSTDGVAAQSSNFSINTRCVATQASLNIQTQVGAFAQVQQAVERGWVYTISPDAGSSTGSFSWQQQPSMDCFIDAGSVAAKGGTTYSCPPITLPPLPSGARVAWTAEQFQQATTLDAGVNLGVLLYAPSSCN
jgi:hypothetical protein